MMFENATTTPDIKLIVVDVDHTLLNDKSELSERNEKALKAAIAKGVRVMIATGKAYGACHALIQKLGLDTPGIFTQGLTIYEANGTLRHQQTLDTDIARRVITFAEDRGFAVVAYAQGRLLARVSNPYVAELNTRWREVPVEYVGPLQNKLDDLQVNKLVLISAGDPKRTKALRWQLASQINGSARLMSGGVPHMLEVLPPNASKGNALRALLKELKINKENVLAIGDGENDIEMIQLAGFGIAVANAEQSLKDAAKEITVSNNDDAVAVMVEKYVLGTGSNANEATPVVVKSETSPVAESKPADAPATSPEAPAAPPAETSATPPPSTEA